MAFKRLIGLFRRKRSARSGLCVMGIMKNESLNIDEWMAHYLWQGADHVVLIDNGSDDDTLEKARRWEGTGKLSRIVLTERWRQREHYWTAFRRFRLRDRFEWLLVADLDEFWFCKDGSSLAAALADYRDFDVVYANWSVFGSGGHVRHPDGLRRNLTMRHPFLAPHAARKWACRTDVVRSRRSMDVHVVFGADSSRVVSDNEKFQINHYVTQSVEFFSTVKMRRGDATVPELESTRTQQYFDHYDMLCTREDRLLADRVAAMADEAPKTVPTPSETA
jgi:hypothetical protein